MFDIGFAELILLMLVGLLVLGPEKLPRVARDAGLYLRKARRAWNQMRHSIEQELDASEMRRALEATQESAQSAVDELKKSVIPESSVPSDGESSMPSDGNSSVPSDGNSSVPSDGEAEEKDG